MPTWLSKGPTAPACTTAVCASAERTFVAQAEDLVLPVHVVYTVPLALRSFVDSSGGESLYGELFAMSALSLVPVFIVFLAFQRLIIRGVAMGALKR